MGIKQELPLHDDTFVTTCPQAACALKPSDDAWLANGSFISLSGSLAGRALHVGGQIALARLMGPATFGLYAIGWTLLQVSAVVTPLGLDNGAIHYATRYVGTDPRRLGRVLSGSLFLATMFGGIVGLCTFVAAPMLANRVFSKTALLSVIYLVSAGFPLVAALKVAAASTTISQSMKYRVCSESLVQPASNLILLGGFYLLGWRLLGAVAAMVLSFGAGLALAVYYELRIFSGVQLGNGNPRDKIMRNVLQFSLVSWLGVAFINLIPWVDRLFVGAYVAPAEVGVYQAASQASVLLGVTAGAFNMVIAPRISLLHQSRQPERLQELYRVATKWVFYASVPFFLVLSLAARQVLIALYGTNYAGGANALTILSVTRIIEALAGPTGILLIFTGRQKFFSLVSGGGLLLSVALNWLLIPRLGLLGAALATCCANTAMLLVLLVGVYSCFGGWPYDARWIRGILAAATSAGVLLAVRRLHIEPPLLYLAIGLTLSAAAFVGSLMLLGLDQEDRALVRVLKVRFATLARGAFNYGW